MKTLRKQFVVVFAILIVLLLALGSVNAATKDGPTVSLSVAKDEYRASEDVMITVSISNPTQHSVRILKWFTPADAVEEPIFTVLLEGKAVTYTGAIYKRLAPTGNDYLTLKSGESITTDVNMGDYYDLSASGRYEVYYNVASSALFTEKLDNSINTETLISEPISFKVEGRVPKGKPTQPPPPPAGGNTFTNCTIGQQTILVSAREQAKNYSANAKSYLQANSLTDRYTTWFGQSSSSRYSSVSSHFTSISTAWNTAGVTFDCKCKQNYYAYVYPNNPYVIYLCKVFWLAPLTGTDSQAGTLIHEMSHFYVVASTQDYVYGQSGAKNLAINNPDNAVMNADNHEYFAENTPFQQ